MEVNLTRYIIVAAGRDVEGLLRLVEHHPPSYVGVVLALAGPTCCVGWDLGAFGDWKGGRVIYSINSDTGRVINSINSDTGRFNV